MYPPRRGARLAAMAALLGLAACTPLAVRDVSQFRFAEPAAAYEIAGRLSARHDADAVSASFHWSHDADRDALELASPLGQTLARLSGDSRGVSLETPDGRVQTAADWNILTSRGLGWALPVEGLAYWIQGTPNKGATYTYEAGNDGALSVLRQDGWTISYQAFAADARGVSHPTRMTLEYPGVELRLAIDAWQ